MNFIMHRGENPETIKLDSFDFITIKVREYLFIGKGFKGRRILWGVLISMYIKNLLNKSINLVKCIYLYKNTLH